MDARPGPTPSRGSREPVGSVGVPQVGDRAVVRYRLPDGSATDLIGWLEEVRPDRWRVRTSPRDVLDITPELVVATRRLPPARGARNPMRISAAELEQISLTGWLADSQALGEWTLRAGGGFTGRANSCLAVGDPGVTVPEAARQIVAFAATSGARAWAQVVVGSAEEQALRGLGWVDVYVPTDVLVTRLNDLLEGTPAAGRASVSETLTPAWRAAYQRSRPNDADPEVLRRILDGQPPRAFAGVAHGTGLLSIGRGQVSEDWLGLASLWTDPDHRRLGWASRVMSALGHWAARHGARYAYLQVAAENRAAAQAYQRLGFRRHHGYLYLGPPGTAGS